LAHRNKIRRRGEISWVDRFLWKLGRPIDPIETLQHPKLDLIIPKIAYFTGAQSHKFHYVINSVLKIVFVYSSKTVLINFNYNP
jgi:hypothetical protein